MKARLPFVRRPYGRNEIGVCGADQIDRPLRRCGILFLSYPTNYRALAPSFLVLAGLGLGARKFSLFARRSSQQALGRLAHHHADRRTTTRAGPSLGECLGGVDWRGRAHRAPSAGRLGGGGLFSVELLLFGERQPARRRWERRGRRTTHGRCADEFDR